MDAERVLTVRWTMTLDDLVDGNWFVQRPLRLLATAIGVAAIAAGAVLTVAGPGWIGPAVIAYGFIDLALGWFRPLQRLMLRRRVAALVGKPCEVVATNDGLAFRQPDSDATFAWSSLTRTMEDARTLAVVSGGVVRMGIPKRAFGSSQEAITFRDEIASRIKGAQATRGEPA